MPTLVSTQAHPPFCRRDLCDVAAHDDVRHSSRPDVLELLGDSTVVSVASVRTDYDDRPGELGVVVGLEAAEVLFDEHRVSVHLTLADLDRLQGALSAARERISRL